MTCVSNIDSEQKIKLRNKTINNCIEFIVKEKKVFA